MASEGNNPANTVIPDFQQNCEKINFCFLGPLSLWVCYGALLADTDAVTQGPCTRVRALALALDKSKFFSNGL